MLNKSSHLTLSVIALSVLLIVGCNKAPEAQTEAAKQAINEDTAKHQLLIDKARLDIYYPVDLTADLSSYSSNQKEMLSLLIDASKIMDDLFWKQAFGKDKKAFLSSIVDNKIRRFAEINYGPWDRLNGDKAFISGYEEKPLGAEFYPSDMSKVEFENSDLQNKDGLYSLIERSTDGKLKTTSYSEIYEHELKEASTILLEASELAENEEFSLYLKLRAQALLSNEFQVSDLAWMDMKSNPIDVVIGPIEVYEDQLFGYRAAYESYVLLKDMAWSERLAKYAAFLPALQQGLPVPPEYRAQMPGTDADLNAYDVIYYSGHSNAGSKTIAINLPNDEQVQLTKGTRRLQLKNAMRAKFDNILVPIANSLIAPEQREHITFNAFFSNTMFHEVAHGLGVKTVLNSKQTVRSALKEHGSALEEGKADILGLYMVEQLLANGEITEGLLEDYYVTFMAGIFRSVRFGASSAHGKANMIRFNYFQEQGAFAKNENGLYFVDMEKMQSAISSLSAKILILQGDGDYSGVDQLVVEYGIIKETLAEDLTKLSNEGIPVDITFNQGKAVLGL